MLVTALSCYSRETSPSDACGGQVEVQRSDDLGIADVDFRCLEGL